MKTTYQQAAQAIREKQDELAEIIVARQYERQSSVWKPFGDPGCAKSVRHAGLDEHTKIMVGGYPFNIAPKLWQSLGAVGYARDARQTLSIAESLAA
jgi:hypothetical protein